MATDAQVTQFINDYAPFAMQAQKATGINAQLILAEWGNEVNWGTQWAEPNNIGNVGVYQGGPNYSYKSIQEGVQAYIDFINNNSRYQSVKAVSVNDPAGQAVALGNSGYASGHYDNGGGPGSSLIADMNTVQGHGFGNAVTQPANSSVGSSSQGGTGGGGGTAPASVTSPAPTTATDNIGGATYNFSGTNAQTQADALSQMSTTLSTYGFSGPDLKTITDWAWQEITTNTDPAQVVLDLQTPGSPVYPIFEKQFPGFVAANQQLTSQGLQAVSVAQYQDYQTFATQAAQAAGLPPGFVNKGNVGVWIGGNVSKTELTARMNDALSLAYNSTPEQQAQFNSYFGVQDNNPYLGVNLSGHGPLTPGQIAALALDPMTAEPLIHQQITAAQIGGTATTVGLGAVSKEEATKLAQAGVNGNVSMAQFAPLAPLEQALPGQTTNSQFATLTPDQLVEGNLLGTASDVRAQQVAQESRKAPFSGGGGLVSTGAGVVGAGSAGPATKTGQ